MVGGGGGARSPHNVTNLKAQVFWNMTLCLGRVVSGFSKGPGAFTCRLSQLRSVS